MILSCKQIEQYLENGYLLVPGLIPSDIVECAEAKMWQELGMHSNQPETWKNARWETWSLISPEIRACYTPEFLTAAMQLGEGEPDPEIYRPRKRHSVLPIFPQEGE